MTAPLDDTIIIAMARLVDDAQSDRRDPSHSDLEHQIKKAGLAAGDPNASGGPPVGKAKRVRNTLGWALANDECAGQLFVDNLLALLRGCGGFRPTSPNYVGDSAIADAQAAFRPAGFQLSTDGHLLPLALESLSGIALTEALEAYVRRARRGADDAALLTGTGKDLLEATAAHVLNERYGDYSASSNFPTLLGQAFLALDMTTSQSPAVAGEPPQRAVERAMFDLACAINRLRNKEGTGHGRPWLPSVTDDQARAASYFMGAIAGALLAGLRLQK